MDGTELKTCTKCERDLPATTRYYHRMSKASDGLRYRCKECRGSEFGYGQSRSASDVPDGKKMCIGCERILPAEPTHFEQTRRTSDGLIGRCKECRGTRDSFGVTQPNQVYDTPDGEKHCAACMRVLPADIEHFPRSKRNPDGFESKCKECRGEGFGVHHPNTRETPDGMKYCSSCEELMSKDSTNFPQRGEKFHSQCWDCCRKSQRQYYQRHREAILRKERKYRKTDRWKSVLARAKARRRARLSEANSKHTLTLEEWAECRDEWRDDSGDVACAYCGESAISAERDHFIPVSSGGGTTADNIVPACSRCNKSKNSSDPSEWYPEQPFFKLRRYGKIRNYLRRMASRQTEIGDFVNHQTTA